ncbi:MAG: ATP-binding protein [Candidatus Dactylopiibacterium sp.]|nr:ATP-binding protein [Candidatus Dactylopiibacterium sp.]
MRFPWPRTLLWRTFLLILLLLGLSLLGWYQIYRQYVMEPRTRQLAEMVSSVINLTRSALLASEPDQRLALLGELNSLEGIRLFPAETGDDIVPLHEGTQMRIVQDRVRQRLGQGTRFTAELNGEAGFFVSFLIDPAVPDDEYWIMLPPERVERLLTGHWIGWGIAAICSSLLGAWLLVLGVTRPLKSFENAVRAVGRGERTDALPESGPQEVATLAAAFNQMSLDLAELESDRALVLAGVSHDLRTPLARLRLGIELSGAPEAEVIAMQGDIDDMERTIRQFLDFAREAQAEEGEAVALVPLLTELADAYQRRGHDVTLVTPRPVRAHIRPQAFRRAITNLIDNALRYADAHGPVTLRLETDRRTISVTVADRGPGIPPEQAERLKRPFTRLESARSNVQGSGLGLAIVERIARQHGGRLDLLAREGGGLEAVLRLARQH